MKNINDLIARHGETRDDNCLSHGPYESRFLFRDNWSHCPACVKDDDDKAARDIAQKKQEESGNRWQRKIQRSGIPPRFSGKTLDTYRPTCTEGKSALKICTDYASNFEDALSNGSSILLSGRPGTGKTHLAAGIGLHVMHNNGSLVAMTTVMRLIRRVKDSWRSKEITESEVIDIYVEPDLLILDEVGIQTGSDFEHNVLFDVINERYNQMRPTIFISNLEKVKIIEFLGERVFDRIKEGGGKYIPFTWGSYRK